MFILHTITKLLLICGGCKTANSVFEKNLTHDYIRDLVEGEGLLFLKQEAMAISNTKLSLLHYQCMLENKIPKAILIVRETGSLKSEFFYYFMEN